MSRRKREKREFRFELRLSALEKHVLTELAINRGISDADVVRMLIMKQRNEDKR
ncbi:MAG: hypothetical protein PVSMB8_00820 [Vulcanimicrobiaceae bacterium]